MKKLIDGPLRWLFKSTPGIVVLIALAGVGGAFAASSGNDDSKGRDGFGRGGDQGQVAGLPGQAGPRSDESGPDSHGGRGGPMPPMSKNLSDADRAALEKFGQCMQSKAPTPGSAQPSDPKKGKEQMDAAFDSCKSNLTDALRKQFEQHQKDGGPPMGPPPGGGPQGAPQQGGSSDQNPQPAQPGASR